MLAKAREERDNVFDEGTFRQRITKRLIKDLDKPATWTQTDKK